MKYYRFFIKKSVSKKLQTTMFIKYCILWLCNKSVSKKIYFKNFLASLHYINFSKRGKFKNSIIKEVNKQNKILMRYYNKVSEYIDVKHLIIDTDYKADRGHKWGIAPFHYEKGYYLEFINYLNKIISIVMNDSE